MNLRLREYCLSKPTPLDADDLVERAATNGDSAALDSALVDFFSELTVKSSETGERVAPMRSSALAYKSHITRWILNHTDGKVDIGSPFVFKRLDELFKERWYKNSGARFGGNLWGRNKMDVTEYKKSSLNARKR